MQLHANAFSKCAPAIGNTLKHCGSVGLCDAIPLTSGDLDPGGVYLDDQGDVRVLDHLLMADFEIKQCEANQDGWYEFLMSQRVNMSHKVVPMGIHQQTQRIAPFLLADQLSPINDTYWLFNSGDMDGDNLAINVVSPTNIPVSTSRFMPVADGNRRGRRVYLFGQSDAGSATQTAWTVVSVADSGNDNLELVLAPMNDQSNLASDRLEPPTEGYLRVGTNNVDDYEQECNEMPSYLNNKEVPFWMQTVRWSWCDSTRYAEYRELVMKTNALWRKFFDLPETKRNKQLMLTQQRDWTHQFFYAKPLENQDLATYTQLDDIESFEDTLDPPIGVDGGVCVGKRAEATGVIEQLAECGRVLDLLGVNVNLPSLFRAFYDILRVRESNGDRNKIVDVFTDSFTADILNQAMWKYYSSKITDHNDDAILRANKSIDSTTMTAQKANFGFSYKSYPLDFPAGCTMNVITHYAFDDELDVANQAGITATARKLWILDFKGIYPGIVASNSLRVDTGKLKDLAAIRQDFACVMKVHTKQQSLFSMTYAVIVECPFGNLILENFNGFDHLPDPEIVYGDGGTTTTTTTPP